MAQSSFPIPDSLQDLEREPYNLLPYPHDFGDENEAARAESFDGLVGFLVRGNRSLEAGGISLFTNSTPKDQDDDIFEQQIWMDEERIQALYTLVRKSTSLALTTRSSLIQALCQSVTTFSSILESEEIDTEADGVASETQSDVGVSTSNAVIGVMPQSFRDAFACHLYMLYSVMIFMESEAKIGASIKPSAGGPSRRRAETGAEVEEIMAMRASCAQAMLVAAETMGKNRKRLWKRGVPDESVVNLPCRIAYQMLENATGVLARRAASADAALAMIAVTVDSSETLLGTIVATLMNLLHSFEHMAPLCAELCSMPPDSNTTRLAIELIREIGRMKTQGQGGETGKASGIKFVAPFVSELALRRPRLALANISHLLPHLNSEPYCLRSSIVVALGHIVEHIAKSQQSRENPDLPEAAEPRTSMLEAESSGTNLVKSRNALLDILESRSHDVSSYTRSAVLKVWIGVTQGGSLPMERVTPVTALAIDRLQDKTVMVRKQAMQLLTALLENNPFMGELDPKPYRDKLAELYEYVKANLPPNVKEAHDAALEEAKENGDNMDTLIGLEQATLAAAIAEASSSQDTDGATEKETEFRAKVEALKFAQSAMDFIDMFESASAAFHGMLLSANTSDVTEALRFFVRAHHFKLPCAITGVKQSLALMWSSEQSIKDEVLKAFIDVFIAVPGTEGSEHLPNDRIAYNLLTLAESATVSELASIEEAVGFLVKDERIPADVFSILWSAISKGPRNSRTTAIHVLSMGASADRSIVDSKSRLKLLLDEALGDQTEECKDWGTARAAAIALQRIGRAHIDLSCAKYLVLERIMERLCTVARGDWCIDSGERDTLEWFSAAEEAVAALFVICPQPEVACSDILRGMHSQTLGSVQVELCHPFRLARFFHVLGHIALKLLVYTEALSSSVRRANAKRTLMKQEEADKAKARQKSIESDEDDQIEAELGMAAEAEAENERKVAEIAEKEIVGRGLISMFGPLVVRVVWNENGLFHSEVLRQTATLALCKLMCVSSAFCEKHLPVLFSALANAPSRDTTMRANTVVALGDLAFRFPNEVEPYTPRLYACLRDSSIKVRRHTLMVLTHLILNDMVKVKGQVCEIALCLRDVDKRIRDMSRLLFHELSKRSNNPVYNLLPDIISQLSQCAISKEDFRGILAFLLGYIKKDRQNEMLVEKLCQRFPKCPSVSQQSDIAYCMAQLKVSERSIKCLLDNFKLYKDALFDDDVRKSFLSILSKAKKIAKPDLKQSLDEWEAKLTEHAEIGIENQQVGEKAARARAQASRRVGRRQNRKLPVVQESDGEDDDTEERKETEDKENNHDLLTAEATSKTKSKQAARGKRAARARRKRL